MYLKNEIEFCINKIMNTRFVKLMLQNHFEKYIYFEAFKTDKGRKLSFIL